MLRILWIEKDKEFVETFLEEHQLLKEVDLKYFSDCEKAFAYYKTAKSSISIIISNYLYFDIITAMKKLMNETTNETNSGLEFYKKLLENSLSVPFLLVTWSPPYEMPMAQENPYFKYIFKENQALIADEIKQRLGQ
jgi:hypothetical protein